LKRCRKRRSQSSTWEAIQMNDELKQKLANASYEEEEWQGIKFKLSRTSIKNIVILNVGGRKYTTNVSTLTCMGNPFFTVLFSEQGKLERNPNDNKRIPYTVT
ncbi:unnamed protein product, partial [Adineta steineri]